MRDPGSICRNELELGGRIPGSLNYRRNCQIQKKNLRGVHCLKRKVQIIYQEISKILQEGGGGDGLYLTFSLGKIALSQNICESLIYAVTLYHQSFTIKTSLRQGFAENLVIHTTSRTLILSITYQLGTVVEWPFSCLRTKPAALPHDWGAGG